MSRLLIRSGKDPFTPVVAEATAAQDVMNTNVGNYLFAHAIHRALMVPGAELVSNATLSETRPAEPEDVDRVNDEFDAFVIPLANAFRPQFAGRLANLTTLVKGLDIPVVVIGVGAQTDLSLDRAPLEELAPVVREFVAAVLDRSASIGVRGDFTQRYLVDLGFPRESVRVIGCPSLFLRGRDFQLPPVGGPLTRESRIGLNVTQHVPNLGGIVAANTEQYPGLVYVGQDRDDLDLLLWGRPPLDLDPQLPLHPGHPLYRQDRIRFFLDAWTWFDFMATCDFAFGTRFHGNVAALLAGTPAMLLAHDSRTLELAQFHELPHLVMSSVPADVDAATLFEQCDVGPFNKAYAERFDNYLTFLEGNGLAHIYTPGNENPEFDQRVAAATFPPPVRTVWAGDPDAVADRLRWLHEGQVLDVSRHAQAYRQPYPFPPPRDAATKQRDRLARLEAEVRAAKKQQVKDGATIAKYRELLDRQDQRLRALERTPWRRVARKLRSLLSRG